MKPIKFVLTPLVVASLDHVVNIEEVVKNKLSEEFSADYDFSLLILHTVELKEYDVELIIVPTRDFDITNTLLVDICNRDDEITIKEGEYKGSKVSIPQLETY